MRLTRSYSLIIMVLLISFASFAEAKLYKWVDENGKIHYSDKVVADDVNNERSVLNDQGMESGRVNRAKSRKTLMEEAKIQGERDKLLKEQQELLNLQQTKDKILLRTFQGEGDIRISKKGKLDAIDVKIKVDRSNIRQSKRQLEGLQKKAATSELQGEPVGKALLESIESLRQRLKDSYAFILKREQKKAKIREDSYRDLKRFRELKNLAEGNPLLDRSEEEDNSSLLDTVVPCMTLDVCDALWAEAEQYVRQHATTRIQVLSDSIVITRSPVKNTDISLTVSMLRRDKLGETFLFFDLQCTESLSGQEFCKTPEIQKIRTDFKPIMMSKMRKMVEPTEEKEQEILAK